MTGMASPRTFDFQLIDKDSISKQQIREIEVATIKPLDAGSIRTQTVLIGLSANNVSYAAMGRVLKWWDAYPIPTTDSTAADEYGLVPGWGFAKVVESTIEDLPKGQLMWGYWPFHNAPVDLQLERHDYAEPVGEYTGFWWATSSHRKGLMNLYNRYFPVKGTMQRPQRELDIMAWRANLAVWESGFLLSDFVFASAARRAADGQVHPFGAGKPWTAAEADPSASAVVVFGASSRTGLTFVSFMRQRQRKDGFARLVGVASSQSLGKLGHSGLYDSMVSYDLFSDRAALSSFASGLSANQKRIILLDLASRGDAVVDLYDALVSTGIPVQIVKVGGGPQRDPTAAASQATTLARMQEIGFLQMNASAIRDDACKKVGEAHYAKEADEAFKALLERGGLPGARLTWGYGVRGTLRVEEGWRRLCAGEVGADESLVYTF